MKNVFLLIAILFAVTTAYAQWEPEVRLTNATDSSYTSWNNARNIATNGDFVHVVWYDKRDGNLEIYYKNSPDGGIIWGEDVRITNDIGKSSNPSVSVSGADIHIVWTDNRDGNNEVYYKRSTDGGLKWGADVRLTNDIASSSRPTIANSGQIILVSWEDNRDGNWEIYYKRSIDRGLNWGADTRITNSVKDAMLPGFAVSGSDVHLVWSDYSNSIPQIFYKYSTDGGENWSTEIPLSNSPVYAGCSCISVAGSSIHLVWLDMRDGNREIYYKRSTDGGISWEADRRLTNDPNYSLYPSIIADGSNVHIVWMDNCDGNYQIYYKHSTNEGVSWSEDIVLSDNFATASGFPNIAFSGSIVHTVWTDKRNGPSGEIYYKRNPTGNAVSVNENEYKGSNLDVSPNPASDLITITLKPSEGSELSIYNTLGEKVMSVETLHATSLQISVTSLPEGVYFINNGVETKKFVVIR